jgi:hypothetical protein
MRDTAEFQLNYLNEWEASHNEDDEVPQQIAELRLIRPHLEAVSMGSEPWDDEKVARLIKLSNMEEARLARTREIRGSLLDKHKPLHH